MVPGASVRVLGITCDRGLGGINTGALVSNEATVVVGTVRCAAGALESQPLITDPALGGCALGTLAVCVWDGESGRGDAERGGWTDGAGDWLFWAISVFALCVLAGTLCAGVGGDTVA